MNFGILQSFNQALQASYPALEGQLRSYVQRFGLPAVKFKLDTKLDIEKEMQLESLAESRAQFYSRQLRVYGAVENPAAEAR